MAVKVMFQVAGEILGSDILGQIGNAKSWIGYGVSGRSSGSITVT